MRLPSNHGAEARVVVVEDDRRRLAEASDEIAADSGGTCLKVPRQAPSKQAVHIRESSRPQSHRSLPGLVHLIVRSLPLPPCFLVS